MHRPPTWRPSRSNPRHERVSFVTVTQARRASRDGSTHSLIRPATPSTLGPSRERTANGRAVARASTGYIAAIDESLGGATSARPGVQGSPQREPALPTETASRAEYARRKVESSFGAGLDRSPVAPPGTGCSPANGTPKELRRWLVPACYQ